MKKIICLLTLMLLTLGISFGENDEDLILLIDNDSVLVSGQKQVIDPDNKNVHPIIINSRTYLPVKFISEALGASVSWDEASKEVTIFKEDKLITFKIGQLTYTYNKENLTFETAPFIKENRTYIQLSSLLEIFEKEVVFNNGIIIIGDSLSSYQDFYFDHLRDVLTSDYSQMDYQVFNDAKQAIVKVVSDTTSATGFFISEDLVLTNYHVVETNLFPNVITFSGEKYETVTYWVDAVNDLALLKVVGYESPTTLDLSSQTYNEGDDIYTIGNPLDKQWQLEKGTVTGNDVNVFTSASFILTDVKAAPGSSGSPLILSDGSVIGVISGGVENTDIRFASDINQLISNLDTLTQINPNEINASGSSDLSINKALIEASINAILDKDRAAYEELFWENSPFLDSEYNFFDDIVTQFENAYIGNKQYVQKSNANSYQVSCHFTLETANPTKYVFLYHIKAFGEDYKITANLTLTEDEWDKYVLNPDGTMTDVSEIKALLEPGIIDTAFDPNGKAYYETDRKNKTIKKRDVNGKTTKLTLPHHPERMVIVDKTLYVTLPIMDHDSHRLRSFTNGYVGVVDLESFTLTKMIDVSVDPFDLDVKGNYLFVSGGSSTNSELVSIDLTTNQEIDKARILERSLIEVSDSDHRIAAISYIGSKKQFHVYTAINGQLEYLYESIEDYEPYKEPEFALTPKSKYLVNENGLLYRFAYLGERAFWFKRLGYKVSSVTFDKVNNRMFITPKDQNEIKVYDLDVFEHIDTIKTSGTVSQLFYADKKLYTVEDTWQKYYTYSLTFSDKEIPVEVNDMTKLDFIPDQILNAYKNKSIIFTSVGENKIYKYDLETESFTHIEVKGIPYNLSQSPYQKDCYFQLPNQKALYFLDIDNMIVKEVPLDFVPLSIAPYNNHIAVVTDLGTQVNVYKLETMEVVKEIRNEKGTIVKASNMIILYNPKDKYNVETYLFKGGNEFEHDSHRYRQPMGNIMDATCPSTLLFETGGIFSLTYEGFKGFMDLPMGHFIVDLSTYRTYIPQNDTGLLFECDPHGTPIISHIQATYEVIFVIKDPLDYKKAYTVEKNGANYYIGKIIRFE